MTAHERLKRFRENNPNYDSEWQTKNKESVNASQRRYRAKKTRKPIDWTAPWAEGLDEPMIAPWLIPTGYVQEYNSTLKTYRVRKMSGNYPIQGYALEDLFTFPEIAAKMYLIDENILQ